MASFTEMDPQDVLAILEGQEDLLTPEVEKTREFFEQVTCVQCGDDVRAVVDSKRPFRPGMKTPNYLAECVACECLFSPYTGLVVTRGVMKYVDAF